MPASLSTLSTKLQKNRDQFDSFPSQQSSLPFAIPLLLSLSLFLVLPIFFPQSKRYNLSAFWLQNIYKVKFHRLMKDQIVVSMTGFVRDSQQQNYKKTIGELGLRLASTLSEETSVLIVNDVTTEKYKIAKTYDPPINCVTIQWLLDCKKKNKVLPTENYQIKKMFYGAYIKILDFDQDKGKRLEARLTEGGAIVKVLKSNTELGEILTKEEKISLLVTTSDNFTRLKFYISQIVFPVVGLEWVEDSIRGKMCKYPYDYAFNQFYICSRAPVEHYKKMKSKLELHINREPAFKFQSNFLENTIVYISDNVQHDLAILLKRIIMVLGGFYLDTPSPVITHVLTEPLTETEYSQLNMYGSLVFIVRVEWLIDSIYLNKRMREEDYFIRSFKAKASSTLQLDDYTNNQNSTSFNSFGGSLPTLLHRKSISVTALSVQKVKGVKKYVSTLFKDWTFYLESSQKKEVELMDLTAKIRSHGGLVCDSRANIQHGHCFYILKDSVDCGRMIDRLKSDTKGQVQIQPVSYRWINECIMKGQYIDIHRAESYIYKPFPFKTPIMGFHKMVFDVLGLDDVSRLRIKELYNTLGSVRNTPNRIEITHCLCGQKYKEIPRYKEIRKENISVKFVDWKWIIDCVNTGKILDCEKYLLEKEGGSPIQQDNASTQLMPQQVTV